MGGSAQSTSQVVTSTTTTTNTDSFNRTLNRVNNLSNVGNISLNAGGLDTADTAAQGNLGMILAIGAVVVIGLGAIIAFRR